jgi:hypothetical protein
MLIHAIDQRAVEIEQKGGFRNGARPFAYGT